MPLENISYPGETIFLDLRNVVQLELLIFDGTDFWIFK
jgi:hypothetical protein